MVITVPLRERAYEVVLEPGELARIPGYELPPQLAVLSNETVAPLYAEPLCAALRPSHQVLLFKAPEGEAHKNLEWVHRAYDALADFGMTRHGAVLAVGGGVVGDWAGFVAATWMRGVPFMQVPTTLLAMVDASVGGKTGVNHPRAKNLIGAFHQPFKVVADPTCLATLPPRELRAGLAEVIKHGVIADVALFDWLEQHLDATLALDMPALQHIIARSVAIKAEVVGADERENDASGRRATLNYGHTVGHAIEATTAYGRYLHGEAIAIGMTVAARLALQLKVIDPAQGEQLLRRQTALFRRAGLPTELPPYVDKDALWHAMTLDKKARGDAVNFILPTSIGTVVRVPAVPRPALMAALS